MASPIIQKKICMLGSFAVGKTSLVRRFVESIYSDNYHTTVGVKIDKKIIHVGAQDLMMLLWDLAGADDVAELRPSYLRGAAGYLLVVDGTRETTFYVALSMITRITEIVGNVPFVMLFNKYDLVDEWQIDQPTLDVLIAKGYDTFITSAKNGDGVEDAFLRLAQKLIEA